MNISKDEATLLLHGSCNVTHVLLPFDVALHVLNVLLGLPTHSCVLWLIVTGTGRGKTSEIFSLNLSVCEMLFGLRSVFAVSAVAFPKLWDVMMFLSGFVITGRPLFQSLICVERYLAVVRPVTFLKLKPLRYRLVCSAFTWTTILTSCVLCLRFKTPCLVSFYTCLYITQFLMSLFLNLFCCVAVLRALRQSGPGERGKEREEENLMKRRAFFLMVISTVELLLTYVPSSLVALQHLLPLSVIPELDTISLACFLVPGFVQPVLFIHRVGKLSFCRSTCAFWTL